MYSDSGTITVLVCLCVNVSLLPNVQTACWGCSSGLNWCTLQPNSVLFLRARLCICHFESCYLLSNSHLAIIFSIVRFRTVWDRSCPVC
ncbi:hypothetical protein QBC45DRAFT_411986 [Copromyces sp. CBS 386.78]|nr:hypothetical protein QBC45DRAFT_411986 [Copromyces sp. CBS 386.78]